MNNLLLKLKISAALIVLIILNGSVYSQTLISSANVSTNTSTIISKQLTKNINGSISLESEPNNWMSKKNYLDFSSSSNFNISEISVINEDVFESNKIESWMFEKEFYEIESHLDENQIEAWMLNKQHFEIGIEEVSIEDWMTDDKFWVVVN